MLYLQFWRDNLNWETWRACFIYALGAWWGLGDSLRASLAGRKDRLHREMEQRSKV